MELEQEKEQEAGMGHEVRIEMPAEPPTATDYWAGFRAGATFVAAQMGQALNAALVVTGGLVQRVGAGPSSLPPAELAQGVHDDLGGDVLIELDSSGDSTGPSDATSASEGSSDACVLEIPVADDAWAKATMHAVLGAVRSEEAPVKALRGLCRDHFGGARPADCQDRLFALVLDWRVAQTEAERQAGARLIRWVRAFAEERPAFHGAWHACELQRFLVDIEALWQNLGESSLATPEAVLSNLLQLGYAEDELFDLLGRAIGDLDRRAKGGDEGEDGLGEAQLQAVVAALVDRRLQAAQQTMAGWVPEAVQHTVDQLAGFASDRVRRPAARRWRIAIGVPLTVFVQKPVCIFLGRCVARQTVEALFEVLREAGYSNREIAAVFGVLSTGTLAAGYAYLLLHRTRHPLSQQFRHWRFSTVVMQAGQLSAILLSALGPVVAGSLVPDVHGKTLRWGAMAAYTATQAYMTIVSKFVRQAFQSGSSGPVFPMLQLNGVPKSLKVRQQVFRDAAGILGAALVTALSVWCPLPSDGRTLVTRVITEDFYLMLTDWFSDDPTELASVLLMRWFPGELDPATLSISPKDVPNPFGLSGPKIREGMLEVLDNGCSRVFNGLGDALSFTAKSLELADQPGAAMFVKWLNLLVKAPLSTRRSTLLTVLRTGVGDPRGIQSRALSMLASLMAGHTVELDGEVVPLVRDLTPNELAGLSLLALDRHSGELRPAPLAEGFRVRVLTLPEGRGRYRFFELWPCVEAERPFFHQVAEAQGAGHSGCLAAFNMATMALLGGQSPDPEHAYAWLLASVLDEDGRSLPTPGLCWAQVMAHFHRVHPRAARLRLRRLHWDTLGALRLDDEERGIRRALKALKVFGLSLQRAPGEAAVHVLVVPMGYRYGFFSPHMPGPMGVTPRRQRLDPLDAILWWRDWLLASSPQEATAGGLIEVEADPLGVVAAQIEILSLAQDGEKT